MINNMCAALDARDERGVVSACMDMMCVESDRDCPDEISCWIADLGTDIAVDLIDSGLAGLV